MSRNNPRLTIGHFKIFLLAAIAGVLIYEIMTLISGTSLLSPITPQVSNAVAVISPSRVPLAVSAATQLAPTATATQPPPPPTSTFVPTPSPLAQQSVVFEDNFDGFGLDGSKWSAENNPTGVSVGGSTLRMASAGSRYPYLHTRFNVFPQNGNFRMTYAFSYSNVSVCGVGVLISSFLTPAGLGQNDAANFQQNAERNGLAAGIWQSIGEGLVIWFRAASDRIDIPVSGPDSGWHLMTIDYLSGQYRLSIDNRPVYDSRPTSLRPQFIWMGHPSDLGGPCSWSTLVVDFVRIDSVP